MSGATIVVCQAVRESPEYRLIPGVDRMGGREARKFGPGQQRMGFIVFVRCAGRHSWQTLDLKVRMRWDRFTASTAGSRSPRPFAVGTPLLPGAHGSLNLGHQPRWSRGAFGRQPPPGQIFWSAPVSGAYDISYHVTLPASESTLARQAVTTEHGWPFVCFQIEPATRPGCGEIWIEETYTSR